LEPEVAVSEDFTGNCLNYFGGLNIS